MSNRKKPESIINEIKKQNEFSQRLDQAVSISDNALHVNQVESSKYATAYKNLVQRVLPSINTREPETFAFYGSAEKYYENSFSYIYSSYPYDGSRLEKVRWSLSASAIDLAVLQHEYPKETGHVAFSPSGWGGATATSGKYSLSNDVEYIKFSGGPYVGSTLSTITNRESSLKIDPSFGNTVEFWLKKDSFVNNLTESEIIFDSHTPDISEGNSKYGRFLLELSSSSGSPFHLTYMSGTHGLNRLQVGDNITSATIADGKWHHYAFVVSYTGGSIVSEVYVDGVYNSKIFTVTSSMGSVESTFNGTIGAMATQKDSTGGLGYGKLSGSIDEFRFWKVARTAEEIGNNFDFPVHGCTDTENINSKLGIYYKFNEGITDNSTTDKVVLDYSGRLNNGEFVGYGSSNRSPISAISTSTATQETELGDPIINPSSSRVKAALEKLKNIGQPYDEYNNSSIFKTVPQWAYEPAAGSSNLQSDFSILLQAIASKFDSIKLLIDGIPKIGFKTYSDFSFGGGSINYEPNFTTLLGCEKETNFKFNIFGDTEIFAAQNLMAKNFDISELPIVNKTNLNEYLYNLKFGQTDEATGIGSFLIHSKAEQVKNKILNSVHHDIDSIYNKKGTAASFRNLIRCFGTDEKLVAPNVYINNGEVILKDKPIFEDNEIKALSIINNNNQVTLFQTSSTSEERNSIQGKASGDLTFESKFLLIDPEFSLVASPTETSLFGANSVASDGLTVLSPNNAGFLVTAIRTNLQDKGCQFRVSSSVGAFQAITTSYFNSAMGSYPWHLAVKFTEDTGVKLGNANNMSTKQYKVEFSGYQYYLDSLISSFNLSSSISAANYSNFIQANKGVFVGAQRTNVTGSVITKAEGRYISFTAWNDYLEEREIKEHAKSADNIGRFLPLKHPESNKGDAKIKSDTLILNWIFDNASTSNNILSIVDNASGSLGNVSYFGSAKGFKYPAKTTTISDTNKIISTEALPFVKYMPIDNAIGDSKIEIKAREVDSFELDSRPISYVYSYEKSAYQVMSREMLKTIAGISAYNNLIGEPIYKYREDYKSLEKLRERFFSNVENDNFLERFIEYYKWIDSSLGRMLEQLQPATTSMNLGLEDVVESHAFERNKYKHQAPTFEFKDPKIVTNILGINELLYDWQHGHAPPATVRAKATIVISDSGGVSHGDTFTLVDSRGRSTTYLVNGGIAPASGGGSNGSAVVGFLGVGGGVAGRVAAANAIAIAINKTTDADYSAESNGVNTVTVTQGRKGVFGNQTNSDSIGSTTVSNFTGGVGGEQHNNCLWWQDRAERDKELSHPGDIDGNRETLRIRANTFVSGSTYVLRKLSRPYRITAANQISLQPGSNRNANKNKQLYKIINSGKQITVNKEDIFEFKRCDDVINPQEEDLYTAKANTSNTSGYLDADADMIFPFSLYSSSVGNDFSNFKEKLKITNNHDDETSGFQGPWVAEHVGGAPHRRVKFGTPAVDRVEAYELSATSTTLTMKESSAKNTPKSKVSRGVARFTNIANIKTNLTKTPSIIGNYDKIYEIVQTAGRSINNRELVDSGSIPSAPVTKGRIRETIDYKVVQRQRSEHVFVNRFSSPGGPETMSPASRDFESGEFSVYNTINYRNLSVREPLNKLHTEKTEQFGYRSGSSVQPSVHMTNRNHYHSVTSGSYTKSRFEDNYFVQHPIPRSDIQYAWITSSTTTGKVDFLKANKGFSHQQTFSTASEKAIQFPISHRVENPILDEKIFPDSEISGSQQFGSAVDIYEDVLVVGAPHSLGASGVSRAPGRVHIYEKNNGKFEQVKELYYEDFIQGVQTFGTAVSVSGSILAISSGRPYPQQTPNGTTWVFEKTGSSWSSVPDRNFGAITGSDPPGGQMLRLNAGEPQGAPHDGMVHVGPNNTVFAQAGDAFYAFRKNSVTGRWSQFGTAITSSDSSDYDFRGFAAHKNKIVASNVKRAEAYTFELEGQSYVQQGLLTSSVGGFGEFFDPAGATSIFGQNIAMDDKEIVLLNITSSADDGDTDTPSGVESSLFVYDRHSAYNRFAVNLIGASQDGKKAYIDIDNALDVFKDNDNTSIFAWIRHPTASLARQHVLFGINSPTGDNRLMFGLKGTNNSGFTGPGIPFVYHLGNDDTESESAALSGFVNSGTRIDDNRWHHIGIVHTSGSAHTGSVKFYVDGVQAGSTATVQNFNNIVADTDQVTIGAWFGGFTPSTTNATDHWSGSIADLAVWNKALSNSEISSLYNYEGTSTGPRNYLAHEASGSLKMWFRMGDGKGASISDNFDGSGVNRPRNRINDMSGNGFHATPVGTFQNSNNIERVYFPIIEKQIIKFPEGYYPSPGSTGGSATAVQLVIKDNVMFVHAVSKHRSSVFNHPSGSIKHAVLIYQRNGDSWSYCNKIEPTHLQRPEVDPSVRPHPWPGRRDHFGTAIAVDKDYLIIGAPYDTPDHLSDETTPATGSIYIYKRVAKDWKNIEVNYTGLNISTVDKYNLDQNIASPNHNTTVNQLVTNRQGPYGWPTWKQIRGYEHPIARAHKKNNTMSRVFRGKPQVNDSFNKKALFFSAPSSEANASFLNIDSTREIFYNEEAFSIFAWIKHPQVTDTFVHALIGGNRADGANSWQFGLKGTFGADQSAYFNGPGTLAFYQTGGVNWTKVSFQRLDDNKWHHVGLVYQKTTGVNAKIELYVDGVSQGPKIDIVAFDFGLITQLNGITDRVSIGTDLDSLSGSPIASDGWRGYIADFAIYNKALTDLEVASLVKTSGIDPREKGPIDLNNHSCEEYLKVWYRMGDGKNGTQKDNITTSRADRPNNRIFNNAGRSRPTKYRATPTGANSTMTISFEDVSEQLPGDFIKIKDQQIIKDTFDAPANIGSTFLAPEEISEDVFSKARFLDSRGPDKNGKADLIRIIKNYKEIPTTKRFNPISITFHSDRSPVEGRQRQSEWELGFDPRLPRFFRKRENIKKLKQMDKENIWNSNPAYYKSLIQSARLDERNQINNFNKFSISFGQTNMKTSYGNDLTSFSNIDIINDSKYNEFVAHEFLPFLDSLIEENFSQDNKLIEISYTEKIYPRETNTYTKNARQRERFDFFGYKNSRESRDVFLSGNVQHKPDEPLVSVGTYAAFPNYFAIDEKNYTKSFVGQYDAVDVLEISAADIEILNHISASTWPLDSRKDFTNYPTDIQNSFFNDPTGFLPSRDQGSRGEGILQNDFSTFPLGFNGLYGTPPFSLVYNRRIPQVTGSGTTASPKRVYLAGEAKWEAASGTLGPFYDSYEKYAFNDIRTIAQDHSVVPEFRISEFVEDIIKGQRQYTNIGQDYLAITGAVFTDPSGDVSIGGQFFKTYSNSDFLKYFGVIDDHILETGQPLVHARITLKCKAAMKFLPYRGFYPAERTVQLYELFHRNYLNDKALEKASIRFNPVLPTDSVERYLKLRANASRYQVGKPFFGPGILMNSIKAGVAVDYPIFMTDFSSTTVSSQLPTDYPISSWDPALRTFPDSGRTGPASNLTFTGSIVNQSAGHVTFGGVTVKDSMQRIKSDAFLRIEFEDLLNMDNVHGESIHDNEPHPSASLQYGSAVFNRIIDRPAKVGHFENTSLLNDLGATFSNNKTQFRRQMLPYSLAVKNFTAETVNFFVEDGHLTTLISKPMNDFFLKDSVHKMRIRFSNNNTVMYDRHSAFGPPVDDVATGITITTIVPNPTPAQASVNFTFNDPGSGGSNSIANKLLLDMKNRSLNRHLACPVIEFRNLDNTSSVFSTPFLQIRFEHSGVQGLQPDINTENRDFVSVDVFEAASQGSSDERKNKMAQLVKSAIERSPIGQQYLEVSQSEATLTIKTKFKGPANNIQIDSILGDTSNPTNRGGGNVAISGSTGGTGAPSYSSHGKPTILDITGTLNSPPFEGGIAETNQTYSQTVATSTHPMQGFMPFVPPFLDPNASPYVDVTFTAPASQNFTAKEILENSTFQYYNFNEVPSNSNINTNYKDSMSLSASLNLGIVATLKADNVETQIEGSRYISNDPNPQGIRVNTVQRTEESVRLDRWVIQTKWETPVLDFTNVKVTALNLNTNETQLVSGSPWKPRYWDSYYTKEGSRNVLGVTQGSFLTASTGMWHQKGEIVGNRIDNIDKGYFLTIEDIPTAAGPGLGTKMGFINKNEENTGARGLVLAKNYRSRVGEIENNKLVKEAVVAIPYIVREDLDNRVEFIKFKDQMYDEARVNYYEIKSELDNVPLSDSIRTIDQYNEFIKEYHNKTRSHLSPSPLNAIEYQLFMMDDFILPPELDFRITDADPFMIYFFQFHASFNREDLANIWQNLSPQSSNSAAKARYSCPDRFFTGRNKKASDVSYVSHYLDTVDLLGTNLSPVEDPYKLFSDRSSDNKTRWLIFKVKQRGMADLEQVRKASIDPRISNVEKFEYVRESKSSKTISKSPDNPGFKSGIPLQFNWPYDYFSFVELIKLDAKIDSYNYLKLSDDPGLS